MYLIFAFACGIISLTSCVKNGICLINLHIGVDEMNTKIEFFTENFIDAIGAGIYKIVINHHNEDEILYIGESVFVLVRCATHLFNLKKKPCYLGFDKKSIENNDITLKFELIQSCSNKGERKKLEKQFIDELHPSMQSGISDRMKTIDEKIEALTNFLER